MKTFIPLFLALFWSFSESYGCHPPQGNGTEKVCRAVRVTNHPRIDGRLDDQAWTLAEPITGFTQVDPNEGEPATEKTEVKVIYDDRNLYVGIKAYDPEPDKIIGLLRRRDVASESDWVGFTIDSRHDHQTAYSFGVNPVGVEVDFFNYNDEQQDWSWDGVWDSETSIDEEGWSAEFSLPFSMLRFSPAESYTWGFNVIRIINRKNEQSLWTFIPKAESGYVSRLGHLIGLEGIDPPMHLEILPYSVGRTTLEPGDRDFFGGIGVDIKYGISTGITLDATVNPDFGQVEADPSVLNLTVYETFYEERRPFFIEGSKIFETPFQLFYSRRIGMVPGRFDLREGDEEVDSPDFTTILGAAKITEKTAKGASVGILEGVTDQEYSTVIDSNGSRTTRLIEPYTNYFVGRLQQDIWAGNSTVGIMATALNPRHSAAAYSGGADWNLKFLDNIYSLTGMVAGSRVWDEGDRQNGYALQASFGKEGGKWIRGNVYLEAESREFEINDLGYLRRNDWIGTSCRFQFRTQDPWWITRSTYNDFNAWLGWNFKDDGLPAWLRWDFVDDRLSNGFNFNNSIEFLNYWWAGGGFNFNPESMNDLDTRGGPLIINPASLTRWLWVESDSRKPISFMANYFWGENQKGTWWQGYRFRVNYKPTANIQLSLAPSFNRNFDDAQWVDNIDDDNDSTHYVYGEMDNWILDLTVRANITFTKDISFQYYVQPFVAVGEYSHFKELAKPASYEFTPYDIEDSYDFNYKSLNSNAVFRWEYRPGSTLFIVWSLKQEDDQNPGDFKPGRDARDLLSASGRNIFLIKLSYWFSV